MLALCDGVARHSIGVILEQGIEEWAGQAPGEISGWEELRQFVPPMAATEDPLIDLPDQDLTYQTLLRSCATLAHYTIDVTADRLLARGLTGSIDPAPWSTPHLGEQDAWMNELATTNIGGVFLRSPTAVRYLRRNPGAFPKKIPGELEKAGLLRLDGEGRPVKRRYALDDVTPYGTLEENLIR